MVYKVADEGEPRTFETKRALVEHLVLNKNSPFLEGDESLVRMSQECIAKMQDSAKKEALIQKFEDHGHDVSALRGK